MVLEGIVWDIKWVEENNYYEYSTGKQKFNIEYGTTESETIQN